MLFRHTWADLLRVMSAPFLLSFFPSLSLCVSLQVCTFPILFLSNTFTSGHLCDDKNVSRKFLSCYIPSSLPYVNWHWARHLMIFILYILWKASSHLVFQHLPFCSLLYVCVCVFVLRGSIVSSCSLGVHSDAPHSEDQVPCPAGLWALWRSRHRSVTLPYDRKKHQPGGLSITRTDGKFNIRAML